MSSYIATALQQPHLDQHMQPKSTSKPFASPMTPWRGNLEEGGMPTDGSTPVDYLTGTQEDYFLGLFWDSYHCTLQIIDEVDFREQYKSLWAMPGKPRKPSALVDIILALCMQYGVASITRSGATKVSQVDVNGNDATIAGRWLYHRSQTLLSAELENPSITTLQCHIFSIYYLCNASFQNMAHSNLALAVRTAHILGLHLEPSESLSRTQRELRKRLWWTLYAVESKTCMKLGRPWSAQISQATCSLPADDHELALLSGSNFASYGENVTWLTYNLQNTKLILTARAVYTAFYDRCADILGANNQRTLYTDLEAMESCAKFLSSSMQCLQTWLDELPDALKTKRKGVGEPFSTDGSPLELELFAPMWLQRQRLLLELLYHNLAMNLYRPFISFSTTPSSGTVISEEHATFCVNHAIAITHIMYQILTQTDILSGWHETFQWQWNANLSMIGFILAYPLTPSSHSARNAINRAIKVFENFGNNSTVAASAADVTRDLTAKADYLIDLSRSNVATSQASAFQASSSPSVSNDIDPLQISTSSPNNLITNQAYNDGGVPPLDALVGSMDLAFFIDSLSSFEPMWAGGTDMSNMWSIAQD